MVQLQLFSRMETTMKIKRLQLKNVRCFNEYELDFTTEDNEILNHVVLVGRNGTGKSTVLKSIVHMLTKLYAIYDRDITNDFQENHFTDKDILFGEEFFSINLTFEFDENESAQMGVHEFIVEYFQCDKKYKSSGIFLIPKDEKILTNDYLEKFNTFAKIVATGKALYFDAFRYMSCENPLGPNMQEAVKPYYSLLQSNIDVYGKTTKRDIELKQWIINIDYMRLKKTSEQYENLYNHLVKAFDLLLHPLKFECINEEGEIIFLDEVNKQSIPINLLSDGFKSIFQIIIATMRMLFENASQNELFYLNSGIVIVDEIDCHIHPRWQKSIMPALTELFPNCQFIVTTHSPYIIESVQDYEIKRIGDRPIV